MADSKNKNSSDDLKKYHDLDDVTIDKLKFGLWWLKNKSTLLKMLYSFIFLVAVISWGYTLFSWGYYYFYWNAKDEEMVRILVQTRTVDPLYLKERSAQRLSVSPVYMLEAGNKYDFYTIIKNSNPRHYGSLSYCFMEGDIEIDCGQSFILPSDEKYILSLANELSQRPRNVKLVVDVFWSAINAHKVPDWEEYRDEHLAFKTENLKFTPAAQSELTEKVNLNVLEFSITNRSPYNYYELPLNIILFRSNSVIAVGRYSLKDFSSNEISEISISWPGYLGGITEAEIAPDINILKNF